MDTTSGALTRTIALLGAHPDVQAKLRQEILDARLKSGGVLSYDDLVALPYLDAVCRETLRVLVIWFFDLIKCLNDIFILDILPFQYCEESELVSIRKCECVIN